VSGVYQEGANGAVHGGTGPTRALSREGRKGKQGGRREERSKTVADGKGKNEEREGERKGVILMEGKKKEKK
jgi:hypothetical protein